MREIKFRVWDKQFSKMIDIRLPKKYHTEWERYELMQYTGLKDKNGVEIYEGDIVRALMNHIADLAPNNPDEEYIHKVWFDDETACFKFDDMTLNYGMLRDQFNKVEVIGNIYENKELLNEKD